MKLFALLLPLAYCIAASPVNAQLYADPSVRGESFQKYHGVGVNGETTVPTTQTTIIDPAHESEYLEVCDYQDFECLCRTTKVFTRKTYAGIPAYDVKTLDPLFIPTELVYEHNDGNSKFILKKAVVAGMRNQELQQFKLDKDDKFVNLSTKANLEASGICEIVFKKFDNKCFTGLFNTKFTAIGNVEYYYESITDNRGVEHIIPGLEKFSLDFEGEPIWSFDSNLLHELESDPIVNATWAEYTTKKEEITKAILFPIVQEVYRVAVHNIRAMAKILPKTAFFNNL